MIKKILLLPFVVVFFPFIVGWKVSKYVFTRFEFMKHFELSSNHGGSFNITWPLRLALFFYITWKLYVGIFYCIEMATGRNPLNEFLAPFRGVQPTTDVQSSGTDTNSDMESEQPVTK